MHERAEPAECLSRPAMPQTLSGLHAGDPPPDKQIEAETSDDEDAPVTSNDEFIAVVAAVRVGY